MAYDEELADRIRPLFAAAAARHRGAVDEKRMFGGIAFMVDAKMAVGVQGSDVMARISKDDYPVLLTEPGVRAMDFTGREMPGYVYVSSEQTADDDHLRTWVARCVDHVVTLPAKKPKIR